MEIQMYTVEQAAEILGARPSTIRTYCREGRIPAMKVGRGYRIAKEDLERWLKKQRKDVGYQEEEQRIAEAEARYKDLFENASDGIVFFDTYGRLTLANPRACELFGYTLEEAEGMHFARFIHPEDLPVAAERFMSRMAGEDVPSRYEIRFLRKDGQVIPVEISSSVVIKEGKPSGAQIILRDMSERKKAEAELRKFKFISDNSNEGHFLVDREARFQYVNKVACEKMGYSEEELLNLSVPDVDIVYDKARYQELFDRTHKERVAPAETINKRKNGETFPSEISSIGIRLDGKPYMFATLRDITERKQAEEKAKRQRAVLEATNNVLLEALTCETDEQVARTCLAVAEKLTGSKFCFIGEVNQAGCYDTIAISDPGWEACRMPKTRAVKSIKNMEIRGLWGIVIKEEKSLIVNDPSSHPDSIGTPKGHPEITSFLGVPLKHRGKTIGMIALGNKVSGYDISDQQAVEDLSVAFVEALMRKRAEKALQESEKRHRSLFEDSPISLWKEDFSQIKKYLDGLRRKGITDFETYFRDHPEEVASCVAMVRINDINRATLELYGAASKKELLESLSSVFRRESYQGFKEELIAIAEGKTRFELETVNQTLKGKKKNISLKWSVVPGYEETMAQVIVSIIDITERKKEMKRS